MADSGLQNPKSQPLARVIAALSKCSIPTLANIKKKVTRGSSTSKPQSSKTRKIKKQPNLIRKQKPKKRKAAGKQKCIRKVPKRHSKARPKKKTKGSKATNVVSNIVPKLSYHNAKYKLKALRRFIFSDYLVCEFPEGPSFHFHAPKQSTWTRKQRERRFGPTRFKYFRKLPKEIRSMIWRASFESRIVVVEVNIKYTAANNIQKMAIVVDTTRGPPTLQASRESRAEALLYYRNLVPGYKRPIYFHSQLDSLTIVRVHVYRAAEPKSRKVNFIHDVEGFPFVLAHLASIYPEIPKIVRSITITRGYWISRLTSWDPRAELQWDKHWGYAGLDEIVVLEIRPCPQRTMEERERFLKYHFEATKKEWPECSVPRIRIIQNSKGYIPKSNEQVSWIIGEETYEDTVEDVFGVWTDSWIKWFDSEF